MTSDATGPSVIVDECRVEQLRPTGAVPPVHRRRAAPGARRRAKPSGDRSARRRSPSRGAPERGGSASTAQQDRADLRRSGRRSRLGAPGPPSRPVASLRSGPGRSDGRRRDLRPSHAAGVRTAHPGDVAASRSTSPDRTTARITGRANAIKTLETTKPNEHPVGTFGPTRSGALNPTVASTRRSP